MRQFGPNVVGFHLATGAQRWYIIGCYLYPDDTSTVDSVVAALKERPRGTALLVAVDLNTKLMEPENDQRGTDIAAELTAEGLEDMETYLLLRRNTWGRERRTWSMVREGKVVRSRTDYILGTDCRLFYNITVRDPRHNTDHYMVLGCLHSASEREHTKYLTGRKRLPLQPPSAPTREDGIFAALRRAVPKPQARERRKNGWISEDTWRLVDERVSVRRKPAQDQTRIRRLSRAIATSLKMDRRRRVKIEGAEVEKLLEADPTMPREAWQRLKWWYKATVNHATPPTWATLERITADWVDLYRYMPPSEMNIPISVKPVQVDDSVPTEDEIEGALKHLQRN